MSTGPRGGCRDVVALLGDYCDDELAFAARENVEAHVATCLSCLAYLVGYRETRRLVRTLAVQRGPRDAALPVHLVRTILASRPAWP